MRKALIFTFGNALLALCLYPMIGSAQDVGPRVMQSVIMPERLVLGDTLAYCRRAVRLREISYKVDQYPFSQILPNIDCGYKTVWVEDGMTNELPSYFIGYFSSESKLIDLLKINGTYLVPLIQGVFAKRLRTIKAGMNVEQLYELVGKRHPEYDNSRSGKKWLVRFEYMDVATHFIKVEADAGSGTILRVWDGTI